MTGRPASRSASRRSRTATRAPTTAAHPSLSSDGRYIAFESDSPGLVAGDTNDWTDVFVRDRVTGTMKRVSVTAPAPRPTSAARAPSISGDGRYVAFASYDALTPDDTNDFSDVYVRDTRREHDDAREPCRPAAASANDNSSAPRDQRRTASTSRSSSAATNLDGTADTNARDRRVRPRSLPSNTTQRVSRSAAGGLAHGVASAPSISRRRAVRRLRVDRGRRGRRRHERRQPTRSCSTAARRRRAGSAPTSSASSSRRAGRAR